MFKLNLPEDVVTKIYRHLEPSAVAKIGRPLPGYWKGRTLKIQHRYQLNAALRDPFLLGATSIDLSSVESLDDLDLKFIAEAFPAIRSITLTGAADISDDGLLYLLSKHGHCLQILRVERCFKLTNETMEHISRFCRALRRLNVRSTFVSTAGLNHLFESSYVNKSLRSLDISRCHLLNCDALPGALESAAELKWLSISGLDGIQPHQIEVVIQRASLKSLDISGCPEITLKNVSEFQKLSPKTKILHDAKLEDHSHEAVRRYLLGLINC